MFYAKSMYLGGTIIRADEVDYNDYKKLGLRCLNCGEEIFLKHGDNKTQHFAHFKLYEKAGDNQETCILRSASYSLHSWRELTIEGKKQRKILFQQFFLDIISNTHEDFKSYNKRNSDNKKIEKILIDNYINQFNHYKKELIAELNALSLSELKEANSNITDHFSNEEEFMLQKLIVSEVIDYLTLAYTTPMLSQIINYCLHKDAETIKEAYKQKDLEAEIIIPQILTGFLFCINWIHHLEFYSGKSREVILTSKKNTQKKIPKHPLILDEKKFNIYIKTGISKYSKNHRGSFLDSTFNNYKFSLEPYLGIIIHEDFRRNRKSESLRKKSQKIAEILDIRASKILDVRESIINVSKTRKILKIYWKIDKLYQEKYSGKELIFCQNSIEEFLSKLFLSKFGLWFLMEK